MSQRSVENKGDSRQYLTFQLGREEYGLELVLAREIIKPVKITSVPNTEEYVLGVINLRGQIVPVIDIQKILGLEADPGLEKNERMIIVNLDDILLGLMVDRVQEVARIAGEEIEDLSENKKGFKQEYLKGVSRLNDRLIIILDIKKVVLAGKFEEEAV